MIKNRAIRALILLVSLSAGCGAADVSDRPNFVWIVSEDNSIHYLRHYFEGGAETPAIESLAAAGVTFRHAFSNGPVCSVARTTLATSVYAPRLGTQYHRKYVAVTMPPGMRLFHSYLRDAGYYVSNGGKTDYNVTAGPETWDESTTGSSWRNRANNDQPFFHFQSLGESHEGRLHFNQESYKSTSTIHDPEAVALADYVPDTELARYTHAFYLDRMQVIDGIVGDIVAQLEEDGLLEDTFVFYFGDHGGVLPRSKGYVYDSGLHVPLVVRIPHNFRHLVDTPKGTDIDGFVSFVDFGPTLLNLAGLGAPDDVDGEPFLGPGVDMDEVNARDESLGYADRFDEKYDFVRTLRKGRYRYVRNFRPYLPDGLQNNYRFRMLAYREWRRLYEAGKLEGIRRRFFEARAPELLFDVEADPHNVHNLAGDPAYTAVLLEMRERLQQWLRELPDLSLYPESHLAARGAFEDPVAFGLAHKKDIASLMAIADLALLPYEKARPMLVDAMASDDAMARAWAATVAAAFGEKARDLEDSVAALVSDPSEHVRIAVADYLGVMGLENPQPLLASVINETKSAIVATEALNSVVFFNDFFDRRYPADVAALNPVDGLDVGGRLDYLRSTPRNDQR